MKLEDVKKAYECADMIGRTDALLLAIAQTKEDGEPGYVDISLGKGINYRVSVDIEDEDIYVVVNAIATLKKKAEKRLEEL